MLGQMMQVGFYGHVRQYKNIQAEIDANIKRVIESGEYVQGPMLKQFEQELAAFHGTTHAIGVGNGTDAIWLALMAMGIGPGDEVITHREHVLRHRRSHLDRRRDGGLRRLRSQNEVHRPGQDRSRDHTEDQGHHPGSPVRPVRRHAGDQEDRRHAQAPGDRGQRAGHRRRRRRLQDRPAERRHLDQLHHPEEPRHVRRRRRARHEQRADIDATVRKLRNHGSNKRNVHSFGFNSRLDDLHAGILSAKLKHIHKWNDDRIQWAERYTAGLRKAPTIDLPHVRPGYRHVFHLYVDRDEEPVASRWTGRLPRQERHRREDALLHRHSPAGRLSLGQAGAHRRARSRMPRATPPAASASRCIRS